MSPGDEELAWPALREQLRWADSFSIFYVFTPTPRQARALEQRVLEALEPRTLERVRAEVPGELSDFARGIQPLLEELSRPVAFHRRPSIWIDGSREFEAADLTEAPWRCAWSELVNRLNERRSPMRESLRAIFLVAPPQAKAALRSAGPDLWSARADSVELPWPGAVTIEALPARTPRAPVPREDPTAAAILAAPGRRPDARLRARARISRATRRLDVLREGEAERASLVQLLATPDTRENARNEALGAWLEQLEVALALADTARARAWLEALEGALSPISEATPPRERMLRVEVELVAGELELARGEPHEARRRFELAHERHRELVGPRGDAATPHGSRLGLGLARAARQLGERERARELLQRVCALQPSATTLRELAGLALDDAKPDEAAALLREALALADFDGPEDQIDLRRGLAASYMLGSHWGLARGELDEAMELARSGELDDELAACEDVLELWRLASGDAPREISMKSALVILHLSDLHFGPHSRFAELAPRRVAERFGRAISRARARAGLGPVDLVVVSGDLTQTARSDEFELAQKFCEGLNGQPGLALSRERWVFVPGNHDLSWAKIKLARAQQADEEFDEDELERRIHSNKWIRYQTFIDQFYRSFEDRLQRTELSPTGWVRELPALRLSLGLLNSCETTTDVDKHGELGTEQARALLDHWSLRPATGLRVVVVHHNPQEVSEHARESAIAWLRGQAEAGEADAGVIEHFVADTFGMRGRDALERLARSAQVSLVLHGHVHETPHRTWEWGDGERRTHVLGAGSAGASAEHLPPDQPNGLQLISIDLETGESLVHRLRYDPRAPDGVELGAFVVDAPEVGGAERLRLSLPDGFVREVEGQEDDADTEDTTQTFSNEYRAQLTKRDDFCSWVAPQRRRGRRHQAELDRMYVPLRVTSYEEGDEPDEPIDAERLLQQGRSLIVRGGPGSGKTTWLRWLSRRMLERRDVIPIFLELRSLADRWNKLAADQPRSFERYLMVWLEERMGPGWEQALFAALGKANPRPVLLVDGWDELGDFGADLGPQLASFARSHPEVLIVATSRPYGEGLSDLGQLFEERRLLPMTDDEVASFVANYCEQVSDEDREHAERFLANLASNARAQDMGRTPLLLGMLLIIGADRPLPDQRHELYRVCLEVLLDIRPKRRQALGALMSTQEWAPEGHVHRVLAAAKLAWHVHQRYLTAERVGRVLLSRSELVGLLDEWDPHQREGFINWLVNGAGLLIERDDGKLQFSHLGFQEYLAAHHLDAIHNDTQPRVDRFSALAPEAKWWEVLRLWAALGEGRYLAQLGARLLEEPAGFWLMGAVLADGLAEPCWKPWLDALPGHFGVEEHLLAQQCATTWRTSRQARRCTNISERLSSAVDGWTWTQYLRVQRWEHSARLSDPCPFPSETTAAGRVLAAREHGPETSETRVAWGRVWMSSSPWWGIGSTELLALRSWPTRRSWIGWIAQSAVSLGLNLDEVLSLPWHLMVGCPRNDAAKMAREVGIATLWFSLRGSLDPRSTNPLEVARKQMLDLSKDLIAFMIANPAVTIETLASVCAMVFGRSREGMMKSIERAISPQLITNIARLHSDEVARAFTGSTASFLTQSLGLPPDLASHISHFAGFPGTRAAFAHSHASDPLTTLLRHAARRSLDPSPGPYDPPPFEGDPLWPVLARHIARCSSDEDRAYLVTRVRDPDAHPDASEILRWGLRYWVGGDVCFEDGSVLTLDELWAKQRERHPEHADQFDALPWLEGQPPDDEIDLERIEEAIAKQRSWSTGIAAAL